MATLEDKILGDKAHNYCSSSEDSGEEEEESSSKTDTQPSNTGNDPLPQAEKWDGSSKNTGPKGVIKDWQRYKQLENEKRTEQELECIALAKKLTLTVKSALDEEKEKAALEDPEFAELLDDNFLLEYQKQRMKEMLQQNESKTKFGKLIYLNNGNEFLQAVDNENKSVIVVIHLYESHVEACRIMNSCLEKLAQIHDGTKFCSIVGSQAGLSKEFKSNGVPALLVYKNGGLISNFIRITDSLGSSFYMEDVQDFLVEHGLLEDKTCLPLIIRDGTTCETDSD